MLGRFPKCLYNNQNPKKSTLLYGVFFIAIVTAVGDLAGIDGGTNRTLWRILRSWVIYAYDSKWIGVAAINILLAMVLLLCLGAESVTEYIKYLSIILYNSLIVFAVAEVLPERPRKWEMKWNRIGDKDKTQDFIYSWITISLVVLAIIVTCVIVNKLISHQIIWKHSYGIWIGLSALFSLIYFWEATKIKKIK